ncbi:ditrans,polycis-undecaprenyl-diphosphate synthase ((2E,6E)-farnesyl-diphosphate specific) [Levilactobacillus zymae]|uniref:Isoprenyl transferase n=1 Tax=Levilactobacillus zymae TaxID=267363 RepID=A0ABQ0WTK0_9LACO|nr:isoprenyl transferase [Levilactobacillus zymae]KRL15505.1 undecaprenyl pyrophosphate synthase [Levilactobacillus zymae DSM 19395]QFR60827.1 isoprenyl transferase [Levilactobacillus zymae]GEO71048.1 ditrans,polycis-undecaprenyl-diphosphate synthase ((2E,6E)-farnesyl-diphosphate specific) [Levilactobacillus zymae]
MFSFLNKDQQTGEVAELQLDEQNIPAHIAIIMDGNGRWAQQRHLPRIAGHKQGMNTVKTVAMAASHLGVKVLTLYAFSTENWKRPTAEVNYLMKLPVDFFGTFVPDLVKNNIRVKVMGYTDQLPAATQKAVHDAIEDTKDCTGMVLNFALNYGGRAEIVTAVQSLAQQVQAGQLAPAAIDEDRLSQQLMTGDLGELRDPDLLIRTSGEERLSNFMLWQVAYSEFVFMDLHWPDFDQTTLEQAIYQYQQRHRRFGGLTN